jgi:hypothetical protein
MRNAVLTERGSTMVRLRSIEPMIFDLLDEEGRFLGKVMLPRDTTIFGPHAATVLLQREIPRVRMKSRPAPEVIRAA